MKKFKLDTTIFNDAFIINGFYSCDNRGDFFKVFEKDIYKSLGIDFNLNETFISISKRGVIRGMHFQTNNPQAKLVSVLNGKAFDVIIDLRKDSKTYKKWQGFELSKETHNALYVPRGFAHGFLALEDNTTVLYQCDGLFNIETDGGINCFDTSINIDWPIHNMKIIISEKDKGLPFLDKNRE